MKASSLSGARVGRVERRGMTGVDEEMGWSEVGDDGSSLGGVGVCI